MSTETNKKLFLQQVEQILEGVMQDKDRVSWSWCIIVHVNNDTLSHTLLMVMWQPPSFILFLCILQLEKKRGDEKSERDRLNDVYLELVEKQRTYYKRVKDFQDVRTFLLTWPVD